MDNKYKLYKRIKITIIGVVLISSIIALVLYINTDNSRETIYYNSNVKYNADLVVEEALKKSEGNPKKASIITDINTVEKKIALTFDGLTDIVIMNKILDLLDEYGMKATFFVPGIKSAEDEDAVIAIKNANQCLGNYTLSERKHMEVLSEEEIVNDLCRTNVILRDILGEEPTLLKCSVTEYNSYFLELVYACGIYSVVNNSHFLSYQSFTSYNAAKSYVGSLDRGSIISIKVEGTLDETEYEGKEKNYNHAINKQISLKNEEQVINKEDQIIQIVEWLLKALSDSNFTTEFVRDFPLFNDYDYEKNYTEFRQNYYKNQVTVYRNFNDVGKDFGKSVLYSFKGIGDADTLNSVLNVLDRKEAKAIFFVTGKEVVDYPEQIRKILNKGHSIGNGGLTGSDLDKLDFSKVYFEIWKCNKLLNEKFGINTNLFMPGNGKYNETIGEAAYVQGYSVMLYNKNPIIDNKLTVEQIMKYFDKGFKRGDIIYFRLDYYDNVEQVVLETNKELTKVGYSILDINSLLRIKDKSILAFNQNANNINKTITGQEELSEVRDYEQLRIKNKGKKAEVISNIYTTQPAVTYIFRGVSDRTVLDNVLRVLDEVDASASFFVTGKEIIKYPQNIKEIINRGHQICNGGYGMNINKPSTLDFNSLCNEIELGKKYLMKFLGEQYIESINSYYMPLYSDVSGDVLEAASALGYKEVVTYNRSTMLESYKNMSADEIILKYFANTIALHRGDILYFRLDYMTKSGEVEKLVKKISDYYIKSTTYQITSIDKMINSNLIYKPFTREVAPESNLVINTHNYTDEYLNNAIDNRYIGSPSINTINELVGFTEQEISKIDIKGKVDTNEEKAIFLTFDDWGSDSAVTPIINVLEKYKVKATFFVRVGNDSLTIQDSMVNPNLLRAIAVEGHDIGNHSYEHMKINIETPEEEIILRNDIVAAHQEMARYIGDTGALKLFFRPPTLAVSKLGLKTVFDCGFEYIINGSFSTHDYDSKNKEELVDKLKNGFSNRRIEAGSIIVMHMSDNSIYTAEALDEIIPYYQNQGYRFAKLSDYLKY